jgi:5-methylcytosine-specific restriction protein A
VASLDSRRVKPGPKEAQQHYLTVEHVLWREAVIARAGGRCQDCGRIGVRLFADHVDELRDGGAAFDVSTGRARCGSCHSRKTARARAARLSERVGVGRKSTA